MKLLITGAAGQIGQALIRACADAGTHHVGFSRQQLDITDSVQVRQVLEQEAPDYVINAAAISDVKAAQSDAPRCYQVNRDGAATLAKHCHQLGIGLLYLSTDYVFNGQQTKPYTEASKPDPQNVYGNSKYEGEEAVREYCPHHIILRTSWLFSAQGNNFFTRVLERAIAKEHVRAVDDQISCPTWTGHLAMVCLAILQQVNCNTTPELWGTYHYCDRGAASRYEFARSIIKQAVQKGLLQDHEVEALDSASLNTRAEQPRQSVLSADRLFYTFAIQQRTWRSGIKAALEQYQREHSIDSTDPAATAPEPG